MGGGYIAAIVFFSLLFFVGFLTLLISPFVDVSTPSENSLVSPIVTSMTKGFEIDLPLLDPFNVNILFFLPDAVEDYVHTELNSFTYIPDYLSIPMLIVMIVSLLYAVASFVPTIAGG